MDKGWNQIPFNLTDFTKITHEKIYFSDWLYVEELPPAKVQIAPSNASYKSFHLNY